MMNTALINPLYNIQRTLRESPIAGEPIVSNLAVETALSLVVTQNEEEAVANGYLFLPSTATVKIVAYDLTISGGLAFPGRDVVIFTRVLRARAEAGPPAVAVDGLPPPENMLQSRPAPREGPQLDKGEAGAPGYNDTVVGPGGGRTRKSGGPGWSAADHAKEMNGRDGKSGASREGVISDGKVIERRGDGGSIFICCERMELAAGGVLKLSADGGAGEPGQPGQDGAAGGNGGPGFDAVVRTAGISYSGPTPGGNGGRGGRGGRGGDGGKGGRGGTITVHCIAGPPAVACSVAGGVSRPGKAGHGGDAGEPGRGGRGLRFRPAFRNYDNVIDAAPNGEPGGRGEDGHDGDPHPGEQGTYSLETVEVARAALASLTSVAQLQMVFEAARADYLVTPPPDYRLRLMAVSEPSQLPDAGSRDLFVLAMVGARLLVRIFDRQGRKAFDWAESDASQGDALALLKQRFAVLPGVLLVGDWSAATGTTGLAGEDRAALIERMGSLSSDAAEELESLSDEDLAGRGAVAAFLLAAAIRGKDELARTSCEDQRNTLIVENHKHAGVAGEQLQGMTNRQLVGVGLRWFDWAAQLSGRLATNAQSIIDEIRSLVGYRDTWSEIRERLGWACALLNALAKGQRSLEDRKLATLLAASALPLLENHTHGLDSFGKTPAFAPGMTFDTYAGWVADSLADLVEIEKYHFSYFAALRAEKDALADLQNAITNYSGQVSFIQSKADRARTESNEVESKIEKLRAELKDRRTDLQGALKDFAANVRSSFGLSIETLFNCLSQLSFVSLSEPVHSLSAFTKAGGGASAAAMAGSQLGTIINEAATNVLNDFGEPVKRELLLKRISVVEESLDLRSELTRLESGFIADDQSKRLLVQLGKFKELCSDFKKVAKDVPLLKDLDRYIDAVTTRNRYVDRYNMLLRTRVDLAAELNRLDEHKNVVAGRLTIAAQPTLPAMAAFVSGLYERAKAEAIADLYLAYRAYALWALAPNGGFHAILGRSPEGIKAKQLQGAWQDIKRSLRKSVDDGGSRPKEFPEDNSSFGRVVVLRRDVHGRIFDDLLYESADLEILPATQSSAAPPADFAPTRTVISAFEAPPLGADRLPNPFFNMSNVRLRKVRVWMVGMRVPGNRHYVELTHLGQERFRTPLDLPYPPVDDDVGGTGTAAYVRHDPVPITFVYDATNLRYDADQGGLTPGSLKGSKPALEDGNLNLSIDDKAEPPLQAQYAPIGPFGKWRLSVAEQFNPGLNLDSLSMIVIDFHGYYRAFHE